MSGVKCCSLTDSLFRCNGVAGPWSCKGRRAVSRILSPRTGDGHLSGMRVTAHLGATWLVSDGPSASLPRSRAVLLQVGFTRDRVTAVLRELLPHDFTLTSKRRYVSVA